MELIILSWAKRVTVADFACVSYIRVYLRLGVFFRCWIFFHLFVCFPFCESEQKRMLCWCPRDAPDIATLIVVHELLPFHHSRLYQFAMASCYSQCIRIYVCVWRVCIWVCACERAIDKHPLIRAIGASMCLGSWPCVSCRWQHFLGKHAQSHSHSHLSQFHSLSETRCNGCFLYFRLSTYQEFISILFLK